MESPFSSSPPTTAGNPAPIPDDTDPDADMPLTMAASVVLTSLPKDAKSALEEAGDLIGGVEKGKLFLNSLHGVEFLVSHSLGVLSYSRTLYFT
jgi:hypothetical protein